MMEAEVAVDFMTRDSYIAEVMSIELIRDEALHLPAEQRAELIDVLWNSLSPQEAGKREQAWAQEAERRIDAFEDGKLQARDSREVLSSLRKGLSR